MKIEIKADDTAETKLAKQALLDIKADTLDAAKAEFEAKGAVQNFDLKEEKNQTEIKQLVQNVIEQFKINDGTKDINLVDFIKEVERDVFEMAAKMKAGLSGKAEPKTIATEVKDKFADLKKMMNGDPAVKEITLDIKADTTTGSVVNNFYAVDIPGIGQLAYRRISLYDTFPKFPVATNMNGTYRYADWDADTTVRAAAAIAEGAQYPESTAKWNTFTDSVKKVGDSIPMTSEFMYDDAIFAAELQNFLDTNVKLVIDTNLYSGTGTGTAIKGLKASTPTYTPVAGNIEIPTQYDLLVKVKEAITKPYGSKYNPDVVYMNSTQANVMKLTKTTFGQYLLPPFVSSDGTVVDGMRVIISDAIANNEMFIGDSRFARIYEVPGLIVERGYINDDFTADITRLKVSRRLNFLIRNVDRTGWLYVPNIAGAIVVIGSTS